ncbi:MAG TPA: hypothetical protein VGB10_00875 [Bacteroidota bacterium]
MHHRILFFALIVFLLCVVPVHAQRAGGNDYALGGSSVMWHASPGALFLNPAELARLHQNEFLLSTNRFSNLSSLSATYFQPFLGTFAAGVANYGPSKAFSLGYGTRIDASYSAGGAVNVIPDIEGSLSFSFGAAMHLPENGRASGLHAGFSTVNLSSNFPRNDASLNAGAAYWVIPNDVRVQAAWQKNSTEHAALLGADARITDAIRIQAGTRTFKSIFGGFTFTTPYLQAHLSVGKPGIVFSASFRISDPATTLRDRHYEAGMSAFDKQDFRQARTDFLTAHEYDESFANAELMAGRAIAVLDSLVAQYLQQGTSFEARNNYLEALRRYTRILQIEPGHSEARASIARIGPKREALVQQLVTTGDSLKTRRELDRARQSYTRALDIDPENETIAERLVELEASEKESVQNMLARAKGFADKNQLDEAQQEYERVQALEPGNTAARTGLTNVRTKRIALEVEQGKALYNEGKHFEALQVFTDILKRDERNREARAQMEQTRDTLQMQVDNFYKVGLQHYVKEDYKSALEFWDKVLLINPTHKATLEYRKRAEDKLKALERLR